MSATVPLNHPPSLQPSKAASPVPLQEQFSAWCDGELTDAQSQQLWQDMAAQTQQDDALHADWDCWHVVRDAMRHEHGVPLTSSAAFVGRLRERLAQEHIGNAATPTAAVAVLRPQVGAAPGIVAVAREGTEAANASVFRWKMVAGFASLAAVAALGWGNLSQSGIDANPGGQLASVQQEQAVAAASATLGSAAASVVAQGAAPAGLALVSRNASPASATASFSGPASIGAGSVMIRDPYLDEVLARQYGNTVALQPPAAFLRNTHVQQGGLGLQAGTGR